MTAAAWVDEQLARPVSAAHVSYVQGKYSLGAAFRPGGASYTPAWVPQSFWKATASGADPLRQRVAFALHQIFMVSQADSNLWGQARAYARYVDVLNQQAFGNFRALIEEDGAEPGDGHLPVAPAEHRRKTRPPTACPTRTSPAS